MVRVAYRINAISPEGGTRRPKSGEGPPFPQVILHQQTPISGAMDTSLNNGERLLR